MKKLLLTFLFTLVLSGGASASIGQLENCYLYKTSSMGNEIIYYDNAIWNFEDLNKSKLEVSPIVNFSELKNTKTNPQISEEKFNFYRDLYVYKTLKNGTILLEGIEKNEDYKEAKKFYENNDLFYRYEKISDFYFSVNLDNQNISRIVVYTDEFINISKKISRDGLSSSKINSNKYKITNITKDKIFAKINYKLSVQNFEIDIILDLTDSKVYLTEQIEANNIYYIRTEEYFCEPLNYDDNRNEGGSSGTAFFVSNKGHLLTNNHVVDGCKVSKITYQDKDYDTQLLATDKTLDLALLKADLRNKSYLNFSEDEAKKMQKIYVGGYPLGKGLSDDLKISSGIVSSLKGFEDNSNEIQIDAAINPGNSGGPIINEDGELVAIAVSGMSKDKTEGINFGIKASAAERFLKSNDLKANSSFFTSSKNNDELLEILEEATVYTYCN